MRGIAIIDRRSAEEPVAVWITSRGGMRAVHANAVVIDPTDPDLFVKVRSLTRQCAVLATEGTLIDGLPVEGPPLVVDDLTALIAETEQHRQRILGAVREYKRASRSRTLVEPEFTEIRPVEEVVGESSASARAFAVANEVMRVWSAWLETDEERRKRTVQPKTGLTPWVMPADMNSQSIPDFPERFAGCLTVQGLV